jgi:hypothetical protein
MFRCVVYFVGATGGAPSGMGLATIEGLPLLVEGLDGGPPPGNGREV